MSEKDFAVSVTGLPAPGILSKKPCYLITLEGSKGKAKLVYFITIDKPDLLPCNFVQVKGIYSELEEEEISKNFIEIITNSPKEKIMDVMFPSHRIFTIRSLVFNANKPSSLIK